MTVKTITIREIAYNKLKSMKRADESFSDVILRIEDKKKVTAMQRYSYTQPKTILDVISDCECVVAI